MEGPKHFLLGRYAGHLGHPAARKLVPKTHIRSGSGGRHGWKTDRPLWMAPALQVQNRYLASVGCSLLSGLLMQSIRLLALMESANWVPICFSGYDALASPWGVPVPGLTGLPSYRFALTTSWN